MGIQIETTVLYLIAALTVFITLLTLYNIKRSEVKIFVIITSLSIFIYSGYGIAYQEVKNSYIIKYVIALICFYIPFIFLFKKIPSTGLVRSNSSIDEYIQKNCNYIPFIFLFKKIRSTGLVRSNSSIDKYIQKNCNVIKWLTIFYFITIILPMFFPKFRLFDVYYRGITIEDRYEFINALRTDSIKRICITFTTFLKPFFLAYLVFIRINKPKSILPISLFVLDVMIGIMDACYIGRGGMIYSFLLLYFLTFCIKDGGFFLSRKQEISLLVVAILSLPFMYAYTFIRQGLDYENLPFMESISLLIYSESGCPTFYDHILSSRVLDVQTPLSFILWLIFLPIPSIIWPNKPSLANDVFTYSITGLHKTDYGYSSLVPSFLGEGFMFFGEWFYWIYALIAGIVFAIIIKYLLKSRYMLFFVLYLMVWVFSIGRAGATAVIPNYVNGTLSIFLLEYFFLKKKRFL